VTVGTLYVVGAPAGEPQDLTRRALRILKEVSLVVAAYADMGAARRLLAYHGTNTPLQAAASPDTLLEALQTKDVALLTDGFSPGISAANQRLIRAALEHGFPVAPIPGPTLAITALVISGLPADSFVYLGGLSPGGSFTELPVMGERRTLVALVEPDHLAGVLDGLYEALGDRALAIVADSGQGTKVIWQGALEGATARAGEWPDHGPSVLVVGGAQAKASRWGEERLRAEIEALLEQKLRTKEISQQLAAESGWRRREVYRLAVEMAQRHGTEGKGGHARSNRR
jgi:16S rRNA (cytidine1402-2'-O)-methyltransferase